MVSTVHEVGTSLLAMPPPVPLGGQLFVALLLLGLTATLRWSVFRQRFKSTSIVVAPAVVVAGLLLVEVVVSRSAESILGELHHLGLSAAIVGAVGAGFLRSDEKQKFYRRRRLAKLAVVAILSGAVLGLSVATLSIALGHASLLDRTFLGIIAAGTLAGAVGASLILLLSLVRSSKSD